MSITSGSPTKPPGQAALRRREAVGTSVDGSTGSDPRAPRSAGRRAPPRCSSSGYQTGNGTPKKRWRLMHQSPVSPLIQSS